MKTLIIITHPNLGDSVINKRWAEELNKHPEKYQIHDLYKAYPDEKIDVEKEQQLLESFDKIVFQFPLYWFSCPPLLKKWFDEVFTYGWAYGSQSGYKMSNKKIALAISAGIDEEDYSSKGEYKYTLKELTSPFETIFRYVKADYRFFYAYYGIEQNPTVEDVDKSVEGYLHFLDTYSI